MPNIDLVIPMVFPQDAEWQKAYEAACGAGKDVLRNVRWRSWGTEGLLIRCCMKYMPWVRRIYILLAGERQVEYLEDGAYKDYRAYEPYVANEPYKPYEPNRDYGPEVRVVFHREFIPAEYLPCFASPCIEMFLHRIPGLSEWFIYGNDDVFPLSPLSPEDFFQAFGESEKLKVKSEKSELPKRGTGNTEEEEEIVNSKLSNGKLSNSKSLLPCQHFTEKPFPLVPNIFQKKCMWQTNMVGKPFGKHFKSTWLKSGHSLAPILKGSCEEVWRRHGAEISANLSPLRRTEKSFNHYIYSLYQHFSGMYIDHTPREQYVGKGDVTGRLTEIIRDPQAGIVCLNDNEDISDWERRAEIVRREISAKVKRSMWCVCQCARCR